MGFILALKGVRSGYPISLNCPWKKGYNNFSLLFIETLIISLYFVTGPNYLFLCVSPSGKEDVMWAKVIVWTAAYYPEKPKNKILLKFYLILCE